MIKILAKHGNSKALVLEKSVLDLLKIEDDTPLEVTTDGQVLIITPLRDAKRRKKQFAAALSKVNTRYGRMLKRLAD